MYFNIHVQHWKLLLALPLYYTYVTNGIFHKFLIFMGHVVQYMGKFNVRTMFSTIFIIQGGSNMTGTDCLQFTHKKSRSYLNHLVLMKYTILLGSKNSLSKRQINTIKIKF